LCPTLVMKIKYITTNNTAIHTENCKLEISLQCTARELAKTILLGSCNALFASIKVSGWSIYLDSICCVVELEDTCSSIIKVQELFWLRLNLTVLTNLVAHLGVHDDTFVAGDIEDSERFCLDFDDQDVEMEETDESLIHGNTDSPFDFDELDYSNYNMLPISVEQADDGVLQVYITPTEYNWDHEVIEFFKTLKWLGGQSTVNMIRGPMWHGAGRGGVFNPDKMVPNLGGPSDRTLTKHSGGYTTESGILNQLMKTFHDIVDNKESTVVNCEVLKVVSVHAENDGTALQPGLLFDPTQKVVVGLANGNIKMDYINNNKEKSPELTKYLKKNIATEAVVTLLTNSPKTSFLSVGVSYHRQKGKTGENLKENLVKEVMQIQCCRGCLEKCPSDITVQSDCCESSVCNNCLSLKSVCDNCQDDGQISYHPSIRACRSCLEKNTKCVKCIVLTWSVDCELGNRKMMDLVAAESITHLEYLVAFPDVVHLAKTYKCSWSNWFLILGEGVLLAHYEY
ncbi:Hypothetical predicted protein, partial [Paramuricea clavata]